MKNKKKFLFIVFVLSIFLGSLFSAHQAEAITKEFSVGGQYGSKFCTMQGFVTTDKCPALAQV